jgi:RNA polymerase sigma-70 factor, ECF subfamily
MIDRAEPEPDLPAGRMPAQFLSHGEGTFRTRIAQPEHEIMRGFGGFEGRAALRSWLYRIATNVCLDMLSASQRRARPMDLGPARSAESPLGKPLAEAMWIEPISMGHGLSASGDPADAAELHENVRLAFVAALHHLPPRQRAVLILRDVLRWKATEVAELLDSSVPSVNSLLQRARSTLLEKDVGSSESLDPMDARQQELLARYVDAFERYDMDALTSLIREDATQSMPPYDLWLRGRDDIFEWWLGPGIGCRGSRVIPAPSANGAPAMSPRLKDP